MMYQALLLIIIVFGASLAQGGVISSFFSSSLDSIKDLPSIIPYVLRNEYEIRYSFVKDLAYAAGLYAETSINGMGDVKDTVNDSSGVLISNINLLGQIAGNFAFANFSARPAESQNATKDREFAVSVPVAQTEGDVELSDYKSPPLPARRCNQDISAKAFLLRNMGDGTILLSKNSDNRWPIASITKLMTSLVAAETMPMDQRVQITEKAERTEGSIGNLKQGEIFSLRDILHAMLIPSSNRAAQAVSEVKNEGDFLEAMRAKAFELGMKDTAFAEPTGLSYLNQSTANDLYKLISFIYENNPDLLEISRKKSASLMELTGGKIRIFESTDKFAGAADFIGGKTGFTDEAQKNLVGVFRVSDDILASVILGSDDSFKATSELIDCAKINGEE